MKIEYLSIIIFYTFIFCLNIQATLSTCENNKDCNFGRCSDNKTCECFPGYINDSCNKICNYEQKETLDTILMSIFLGPFGGDWFYLSRGNGLYIFIGFIKFFISSCALLSTIYSLNILKKKFFKKRYYQQTAEDAEIKTNWNLIIQMIVFLTLSITWYSTDIIRIVKYSFF